MAAVTATDLSSGMVVLSDDKAIHRIERRELCPPTTVQLRVALTLRNLGTGEAWQFVSPADATMEVTALPERELECLYLTDSGCVLFDPVSCEQYDLALWVGLGLAGGPRIGQRLVTGFWRGCPVTVRPAPEEVQQVAPDEAAERSLD